MKSMNEIKKMSADELVDYTEEQARLARAAKKEADKEEKLKKYDELKAENERLKVRLSELEKERVDDELMSGESAAFAPTWGDPQEHAEGVLAQ